MSSSCGLVSGVTVKVSDALVEALRGWLQAPLNSFVLAHHLELKAVLL